MFRGRRMAPPAATVAAKAAQRDPRAAVSFADRVPYVVVHGPPSVLPIPNGCAAGQVDCPSARPVSPQDSCLPGSLAEDVSLDDSARVKQVTSRPALCLQMLGSIALAAAQAGNLSALT